VVECIRDHVRLLDVLPNDVGLTQKIVVSSIFLVTEILIIKDHRDDHTGQKRQRVH
jgi:hypothetical protein